MPTVDLYSFRNTKQTRDVWIYDAVPQALRVQVSHIVKGALGSTDEYSSDNAIKIYKIIRETVAHEHGRDFLIDPRQIESLDVHLCIRGEGDLSVWLDLVEITFRSIENSRGRYDKHRRFMAGVEISAADAIEELNERFRRAGFGYRYELGKIIRADSEAIHQEATVRLSNC